jgi:2-desacetyl-2-hydroxyethyl bacteriochlorophyllide A dehydrogenase
MQGQAIWFAERGRVEIRPEEVPEPGEGEILIEGVVSLISAGTEMHALRGEFASEAEAGLDRPGRAGRFPFPLKYGYQVVGKVLDAGPGASIDTGRHVFAVHPHQTLFTLPTGTVSARSAAPRQYVYPIPHAVPLERAAYTNLYGVALNAVLDAPVRVGDCVAVSGLGVVGMFLAHICRLTASRLVLIDPREDRRKLAELIGADAVVAPEDANDAIRSHSGGRGTDLHFEASGAPAALQTAITGSGQDGTVVVVSNYGDRKVDLLLSPEFHFRRVRLVSTLGGHINPEIAPRWPMARRIEVSLERLLDLDLPLDPLRFPFLRAQDAYDAVDRSLDDAQGVLLDYPTQGR